MIKQNNKIQEIMKEKNEFIKEIIDNYKEIRVVAESYKELATKAIILCKNTLYQWRISFYIGLLLNIVYFLLGLLIGISWK